MLDEERQPAHSLTTDEDADAPLAFGPDATRLIALADKAAAGIAAGAPSKRLFDTWRVIGRALLLARTSIAERHGGRAGHLGKPWREWLAAHPGLRALKESERSHAVWLAEHEEEVVAWRDSLPQRARDRVHHAATARLGYQRHLREQQIIGSLQAKREDARAARVRLETAVAALATRFAAAEAEIARLHERIATLEAVATGPVARHAEARRAARAA